MSDLVIFSACWYGPSVGAKRDSKVCCRIDRSDAFAFWLSETVNSLRDTFKGTCRSRS